MGRRRPVLVQPPASGAASGYSVFDDFSTQKLAVDSTPLFDKYNGEDTNQTVSSYPPGDFVIVGATTATPGHDPGVYLNCMGPGTSGIYQNPGAYLSTYCTTTGLDWAAVNRWSFLFKPSVSIARRTDGGDKLQMGTYIRDTTLPNTSGNNGLQGEHYYHGLDMTTYATRWHLIILNRTPQHRVGTNGAINWGEDPQWNNLAGNNDGQGLGSTSGYGAEHYYRGLTRLYFDTVAANGSGDYSGATFRFKDYQVGTVTGEPDAEISSICALYTGTQYQVTWAGYKNAARTYEVRYKATSMKSAGFTSGTDGGTTTNPNNAYTGVVWSSGALSELTTGVYIAMRVQSASTFTEIFIPYLMGG